LPMRGKTARVFVWVTGALLLPALASGTFWAHSRRAPVIPTIAFIPQAASAMLWDVEHFGATVASEKRNCRIYWNTPTSETDLAGQVSLVDRVSRGKYQGLVLAPNHTLAILAPLRRALATGLPVVVVSAPLDLPASSKLGYIVNDDEKMGELAAMELARLIHGKGSIALVGLSRYAPGVARRVRSAEYLFASRFPGIHIVSRVSGTYDTSRAEELTNGIVDAHPGLRAVLSFTAAATRGVHAALKNRSLERAISLVGCEQDSDLIGYIGSGEIAAVLAENTYRMGNEAVGLISDALVGKSMPALSLVPPLLITRQNFNSAEARLFTSLSR
jgi:ribose transport system substrate-binding protein